MNPKNPPDVLCLEDTLWLAVRQTGNGIYDFGFNEFFACRRPREFPSDIRLIARVGAVPDYAGFYHGIEELGATLIHDPEAHDLCSRLNRWYPLLSDLTPESLIYDQPPSSATVQKAIGWPVFVKGARQTSRHQRSLAIAHGPVEYERIMARYADDPILRWQKIVIRRLEKLRPVDDSHPTRIPASFEFRIFLWYGVVVGFGPYWTDAPTYRLSTSEKTTACALAVEAAARLKTPLLVVDVAQRSDGEWIVIECNDGQESGYAGVSPFALWQNIVQAEKNKTR